MKLLLKTKKAAAAPTVTDRERTPIDVSTGYFLSIR
jgi:hypothetical protein